MKSSLFVIMALACVGCGSSIRNVTPEAPASCPVRPVPPAPPPAPVPCGEQMEAHVDSMDLKLGDVVVPDPGLNLKDETLHLQGFSFKIQHLCQKQDD